MSDIPVNPSSLVVAGAIVNASNPLPCTSVSSAVVVTDTNINPRTWVVAGALVSTANPLPISLV